MKSLEQLDLWITARVRDWSSRLAGSPRGAELLEIRRDILNDVRDHIAPAGQGRSLFPYNVISINIAAEDSGRRALLEGAFCQGDELELAISALLREAGCQLSAGLRVTVGVSEEELPSVSDRSFAIAYSNATTTAPLNRNVRPTAKLTVLRGQADATEYRFDLDHINLGRLKEVMGENDGLRRRNHVAFLESETTVSREHAVIRYDAETGKFRLYDAVSQRGISVFREGRRFEVPKASVRGFQLRPGDEIHLGEARVRFETESI